MNLCSKMILLGVLTGVPGVSANPEGPPRIVTVVHPDLRTGKLVRSVVAGAQPAGRQKDMGGQKDIEAAVERIAVQHSLPPHLVQSVIKVESNYNPNAISPKGAQGLMQLIPSTARRFGVTDTFNPVENIQGGVKYLKHLLDLYNGNYPLALAAYNAGEAAVAKYGGVPPYAETQNYVHRVGKQLASSAGLAAFQNTDKNVCATGQEACATHIREVPQPDGSVRYVVQ